MNTQNTLEIQPWLEPITIQLAEQETARELISEASKKITSCARLRENLQVPKVGQAMLSAGDDRLDAAVKPLAVIKHTKEEISSKVEKTRRLLCVSESICQQTKTTE